jgi:hypothetical protein
LVVGSLVIFAEKVVSGVDLRRRRCVARGKYASNVFFEWRNKLAGTMRGSFKTFPNPSPWAEHLGSQRGNQFVTFHHQDLAYRMSRRAAGGTHLQKSQDDASAVPTRVSVDPRDYGFRPIRPHLAAVTSFGPRRLEFGFSETKAGA